MLKRENIRYRSYWVRLICCFGVAMGVANMVYFNALEPVEQGFCDLILEPGIQYVRLSRPIEIAIVFFICMVPSFLRIERPLSMVVFGVVSALAYAFVALGTYIFTGITLPSTSPLLGLLISTGLLETMAWSDERQKRKDLERLEAAKQQFTDMLVHDLRRKMSSILMSFTALEKKTGTEDPVVQEVRNTIKVSADRMLLQINALLDIRRSQEGKMALQRERTSLCRAVRDSIEEHRTATDLTGVKCTMKEESDLTVEIDLSIFSRVMSNLIWNALQHAPQGSEIEIRCLAPDGGHAAVVVANRGRPIPLEMQQHLFQPFATSYANPSGQGAGTGLGLAFCRLAMLAHGGVIRVESPWEEHGDGVKVTLEFPSPAALHT